MNLLDTILSPSDLRKLKPKQVKQVAKELRKLILQVISKKGGHLASSLGSVELTVALHYVFDTPKDKIIWDVGHQAYGHKVLTGRRERFHTIRQWKGLSGFTSREESEYDHFGAGHASTSISAALGIAEGMRIKGNPHFAISVVGDGSLTGGLTYEAMNNAGHIEAKNLLVLFNDNDMSIDPNVGAVSKFINRTVTHPGYNRLRKEGIAVLSALSEAGIPLRDLARRFRNSLKNFFTPGMLFECFGFRYFGPIDGHNIDELLEVLSFIRSEGPNSGPYLVHALTKKGCGYKLAEEMPGKYHGVSPFKIRDGIQSKSPQPINYQDVFADTLIQIAKEDPRVIAITAAMPSGTGLTKFQEEFPTRFYDVGIAEGHAAIFAAGMATEGFRPVAAIYSTFLQRAYDQMIHDIGLQKLPVIFCLDRAGLVGADGPTHQGAFDLSYITSIPNFVVMAPKDEDELQHMLKTAVDYQAGPVAIRYPRGEVVGVKMESQPKNLPIGKGELLCSDSAKPEVLLIAIGFSVQSALTAKKILKQKGVTTAVINARFAKPLDKQLFCEWIRASKLVVTIEENAIRGGFGSSIVELMAQEGIHKDTFMLGIPDQFIEHSSQATQREILGLDGKGIAKQVLKKRLKFRPKLVKPSRKPIPSSSTYIQH